MWPDGGLIKQVQFRRVLVAEGYDLESEAFQKWPLWWEKCTNLGGRIAREQSVTYLFFGGPWRVLCRSGHCLFESNGALKDAEQGGASRVIHTRRKEY